MMKLVRNFSLGAALAFSALFTAPIPFTTTAANAAHGFWTKCWVNVSPGLQIALPNVQSAKACWSAGKKCLNGHQGSMHFNSYPVLQSAPRVEKCTIAY